MSMTVAQIESLFKARDYTPQERAKMNKLNDPNNIHTKKAYKDYGADVIRLMNEGFNCTGAARELGITVAKANYDRNKYLGLPNRGKV